MGETGRKTIEDYPPELRRAYDALAHGLTTREAFLEVAARHAAPGETALSILEAMRPDYSRARQVAPDDPAIETRRVPYDSPDGHGRVEGLLARPARAGGALPCVLVVHENRGLNPYIEDVARRLAKAGYLAFAPDGLSPLGGYPGNDEAGREMQAGLDRGRLRADFLAAFDWLQGHPDGTGRVGAVGFCYGGGICNALAVERADLACAVPYYGPQPATEDVPGIVAPLLLHYAGLDERINAGVDAFASALHAAGKAFSLNFYPGVSHGFHNDTTPRFDAAAAALSWRRTLDFLDWYLAAR